MFFAKIKDDSSAVAKYSHALHVIDNLFWVEVFKNVPNVALSSYFSWGLNDIGDIAISTTQ